MDTPKDVKRLKKPKRQLGAAEGISPVAAGRLYSEECEECLAIFVPTYSVFLITSLFLAFLSLSQHLLSSFCSLILFVGLKRAHH